MELFWKIFWTIMAIWFVAWFLSPGTGLNEETRKYHKQMTILKQERDSNWAKKGWPSKYNPIISISPKYLLVIIICVFTLFILWFVIL